MIKAIFFDFFGVLEIEGKANSELISYIRKDLKPQQKIGLISNSSGDAMRRMLSGELDIFDEIVLSDDVGLLKPDPAIYGLAAERLRVQPSECIYIDDYDFRVEGALKAGMHGVIYKSFPQMKAELSNILHS